MENIFNNTLTEFYDDKIQLAKLERVILFIIFKATQDNTKVIKDLLKNKSFTFKTDVKDIFVRISASTDEELCNGFDKIIKDDDIIYIDSDIFRLYDLNKIDKTKDIFKDIHIVYNCTKNKIEKIIFDNEKNFNNITKNKGYNFFHTFLLNTNFNPLKDLFEE